MEATGMCEDDRPDLLVSETVDDLRQVFLVDHAFPVDFSPDESRKKKGLGQSFRDWFGRVLGFRRPAVPDSGSVDGAQGSD